MHRAVCVCAYTRSAVHLKIDCAGVECSVKSHLLSRESLSFARSESLDSYAFYFARRLLLPESILSTGRSGDIFGKLLELFSLEFSEFLELQSRMKNSGDVSTYGNKFFM